jgi:hypothetical protein
MIWIPLLGVTKQYHQGNAAIELIIHHSEFSFSLGYTRGFFTFPVIGGSPNSPFKFPHPKTVIAIFLIHSEIRSSLGAIEKFDPVGIISTPPKS